MHIFFGENFRFVSQSSGFQRVSQAGDVGAFLQMTEMKAPKNGYVYVYLSNESATPVYFDDFSVSHNRSALIGEDHYYSFGLRIAAISSKAVATSLNAKLPTYGYQGAFAEEVTDFELNYNEFQLRTYDPQIGRWTGVDPYDEFASPYVGMGNDPTNLNDPSGGFTGAIASGIFQGATQLGKSAVMTLAGAIVGMAVDLASGGEGGKGAAIGAGLGLGASFVTSTMLKSALTWLGEFALAAGPSAVQPNWSLVARTPSIGGPGGTGASAPNAPSTLSGTSPTIDLTPPPVHMPTMQAPPATNPAPAPTIPRVADVLPPSKPTPPATKTNKAPWMNTAESQLGVKEATGNNDGKDVEKYLKTVGLGPGKNSYWCGAFVNWTLKQNSIKGVKKPAWALDWRNLGQPLSEPALGSIATLTRPGGGHVGFVAGTDADRPGWIVILGGNQSNAVNYRSFPKKILKFNYPQTHTPSFKLPQMHDIRKGIRMQ